MAKVTWLGEPGGPDENEWNGIVFPRGEAVEVGDAAMVEKAKANRFYKVAGDKSETVQDNPDAPALPGRVDDHVENAAFATEEQIRARREESQRLQDEQEDAEPARRAPGRPRKAEHGGSRTFAERVPPKGGTPATPDTKKSENV